MGDVGNQQGDCYWKHIGVVWLQNLCESAGLTELVTGVQGQLSLMGKHPAEDRVQKSCKLLQSQPFSFRSSLQLQVFQSMGFVTGLPQPCPALTCRNRTMAAQGNGQQQLSGDLRNISALPSSSGARSIIEELQEFSRLVVLHQLGLKGFTY